MEQVVHELEGLTRRTYLTGGQGAAHLCTYATRTASSVAKAQPTYAPMTHTPRVDRCGREFVGESSWVTHSELIDGLHTSQCRWRAHVHALRERHNITCMLCVYVFAFTPAARKQYCGREFVGLGGTACSEASVAHSSTPLAT